MAETRTVDVIIVAYRNPGDVISCLHALGQQTLQGFQVHVCENGGAEAFAHLARMMVDAGFDMDDEGTGTGRLARHRAAHARDHSQFGQMHVRLHQASENLGYAGAINAVLASPHTGAGDIWILNPDTEPTAGALAALQRRADAGGYGIVGGRLVMRDTGRVQLDGGRWRKWIARGFNINFNVAADVAPDPARVEAQMDYVSGACMYVSRAFRDDVGPMDDRYFLYAEEVDWCMRRGAHRLGFAPDAVIIHGHGTTTGSAGTLAARSALSVYLEHRNKHLISRRHFPRAWPLIALVTLALTGEYLVKGAPRNFLVALSGWWHGLLGRTGRPDRVPFGGVNRGWPSATL